MTKKRGKSNELDVPAFSPYALIDALSPAQRSALCGGELRRVLCGGGFREPKYTGFLADPNPLQIADYLKVKGKPAWYPGSDEGWATDVEQIRAREEAEWRKREEALGKVFGISINRDPNIDDCWHRLAFALAHRYVPGFRFEEVGFRDERVRPPGKGAPVTLSRTHTSLLAAAVHRALKEGLTAEAEIAQHVYKSKAVRGSPRGKAPSIGLNNLNPRTARDLVPQLRAAWKDVRRGNGNAFQYQAVAVASDERDRNEPWSKVWRAIFFGA